MKRWLTNNFLPMWAKETVLAENKALKKKVERLEQENNCLRACLDGVKLGLKARVDIA